MISTKCSLALDYYEVLGLKEKNCNASDVKKAYRKMALRWHPEKNPASHEEAVVRFEKISEAYQILSNSQSRETYDRYRCASSSPSVAAAASSAAAAAAATKVASSSSSSLATPSVEREKQRTHLAKELSLIHLKPAKQVFDDFFGGRNPFSDMFGCNAEGSQLLYCKSDAVNETPTHGRWFPCLDDVRQRTTSNDKVFALPASLSAESTPTKEHPNDSQNSSANAAAGGAAGASGTSSVRQVSTSTRLSNGNKIVTKKITENGVETVTVEENGKLITKTVNGVPVNPEADVQPTPSS